MQRRKNPKGLPIKINLCSPSASFLLDSNEEKKGFIIYPNDYRTWVAFAHDFCKGCVYEFGSFGKKDKRMEECYSCKETLDYYYYRNREQPLIITIDENGKNVAKSFTLK